MTKTFGITIEKDFRPFPVFWHASECLREIRESGGKGSYWAGLAALITLAFAIEGFCQTEGPKVFGDDWLSGREIERKSVADKFKLLGKAVGVGVNYGKLPWRDVKRVLDARNSLAHPRPAKRSSSGEVMVGPDEHPMDAAGHLVMEAWEPLLQLETAQKIASSVDAAIKEIWQRLGRKSWELHILSQASYMMSTKR